MLDSFLLCCTCDATDWTLQAKTLLQLSREGVAELWEHIKASLSTLLPISCPTKLLLNCFNSQSQSLLSFELSLLSLSLLCFIPPPQHPKK